MRRATIALLLLAAISGAESRDGSGITLGYLTERSDAVLVVTAGAGRFTVGEILRGSVDTPTIELELRFDPPVGARYLAFLRGDGDAWRPIVLRALSDTGPESRFPDFVRRYADALDDPARLRDLLLEGIRDADPGMVDSCATDLVRHHELHAGVGPDARRAILGAFRKHPAGKHTKRALALAVAAVPAPGAAAALLDSLDGPNARRIRSAVAEALRRLGDPAVPAAIGKRAADGDATLRADLLTVLARLETPAGVAIAARYLTDDDHDVRLAAAHALGMSARAAGGDAEIEGLTALRGWLARAESENDLRACLWTLAQLDRPAAWDALRNATTDPRERVRILASRYLQRPRQSLIFR